MVDVRLFDGPPGAGKTRKLLEEIAQTRGKYVVAQPRQDLIDESRDALTAILKTKNKLSMQIEVIHSKDSPHPKTPIDKQIEEAPTRHIASGHVVIFITHEGLMSADMGDYREWSIYIDETPNSIKSGNVTVSAIAPYLSQIIKLDEITGSDWAIAKLKTTAPAQADINADTCLRQMAELFKMLRSQRVVCFRTTDFNNLAGDRRPLDWFSLWDLDQLSMFSSITVSASGFEDSLVYRAMKGSVSLTRVKVGSARTAKPQVHIHYFTKEHRGSTTYWNTPKGKRCLDAVAKYLKGGAITDCYWSANTKIATMLEQGMPGLQVAPKQEGSNKLTNYATAVLIYSAKTQPGADKALCELLDATERDIEKAREIEDIKQFVMRGKIRDQTFGGLYSIYVYDKDQADMLEEYINGYDIGFASTIPVNDAGIMDVKRPNSKRSGTSGHANTPRSSADERRKKDRERKKKANAAKKAALVASGNFRPVGRPPKPAGTKKSKTAKKATKPKKALGRKKSLKRKK